MDGHEHEDVVTYCLEFLRKMEDYERQMVRAHETDDTQLVFPGDKLRPGKRSIMFYTHDECIFYANDDNSTIWHPKGEMPLRKKG